MPRVSGWAFVLGVGAALATGSGVAHADSPDAGAKPAADAGPSQPAKPHGLDNLKRDVTKALSAVTGAASSSPAARAASSNAPTPRSVVTSVTSVITNQLDSVTAPKTNAAKRPFADFTGRGSTASSTSPVTALTSVPTQLANALSAVSATQAHPLPTPTTAPTPGDMVTSPLVPVPVGKWMLQESDGQISDWGGQPYQNKTLLEPVNVIIIDKNSTTAEESTAKLNRDMTLAGFPAQPIHSTGFEGAIGSPTDTYTQQPADGSDQAFSDNLFVFPNDHARAFGPAPVPAAEGGGYVWTVAASTETPNIYNGALTHSYVSSNLARDLLVLRLLLTGQATFVGVVPMNNAYNTETETTGDHDGYAVVLALK